MKQLATLLCFLALMSATRLSAQSPDLNSQINEVLLELGSLESDSVRVLNLVKTASRYRYRPETKRLIDEALEIAKLSQSNNSEQVYISMVANTQYALGNYYFFNDRKDSAEFYYNKSLAFKEVEEMPFLKAQLLTAKGGIYSAQGAMSKSAALQLEAKAIYDAMDESKLTDVQKINKTGQYTSLMNALGGLYAKMEEYDTAITYYDLALETMEKTGNFFQAGVLSGNKGELLRKIKKYDEALKAQLIAKEYKEKAPNAPPTSLAMTDLNIGIVYKDSGKFDEALQQFNKAYEVFDRLNYKTGLAYTYIERGTLYNVTGRKQAAQKDCALGKTLIKQMGDLEYQAKACECLFEANKKLGNYQVSLANHEEYMLLKDSLFNAQNVRQLTQLEMQYEFDRQQDLQKLEADTKRREYQRITRSLIAGLAAFALIALLLYRLIRIRQKASKKLKAKNEEISKALSEKEILLREIHHRVKNNLQVISSLLSLQSRQINDPTAQEAMREGRNRVKSMALIHQNLYQDEDIVGVSTQAYISKLTDSLVSNYKIQQDQIQIHKDIDDIKLDVDTIIPLGLVLNELISNALKYAFDGDSEGKLSIRLKQNEQNLELEVKDNGKGLPETFSIDQSKSLGFRLIKAFSDKLKAELSVDGQSEGTRVQLTIPKPAA